MNTIRDYIRKIIAQHRTATEPYISDGASKKGYGRAFPVLALLLASVISLFFFFTPCVNVYWNGEFIGTAATCDDASLAADMVSRSVTRTLGRSYDCSDMVTTSVSVSLRSNVMTRGSLRSEMLSNVDEITNRYVLTVAGQDIGSASEPSALTGIMDSLAEKAAAPDTTAEVVTPYSITYKTVASDMTTSYSEISAAASSLAVVRTTTVETVVAEIAYETEVIADDTMYAGAWEIVTEGVNGQRTLYRSISRENGNIVATRTVDSEVTLQPVNEVIRMGTAPRPLTASYGAYIWPAEGYVSSYFGPRGSGYHYGIDICNSSGTPIYAADGGVVTYAGNGMSGYGNLIIVTHDNGDQTYYAHLNSIGVSEGDAVYRGQQIGGMGTTGRSSGVHLHFEVRVDSVPTDPMTHLD